MVEFNQKKYSFVFFMLIPLYITKTNINRLTLEKSFCCGTYIKRKGFCQGGYLVGKCSYGRTTLLPARHSLFPTQQSACRFLVMLEDNVCLYQKNTLLFACLSIYKKYNIYL